MELVFHSPVRPGKGLGTRGLLLLTGLLSVGIGEATSQVFITPVPEAPFVGGDVVLSVSFYGTFQKLTWYRAPGNAISRHNMILMYNLKTLKEPTIGPTNKPNLGHINDPNLRPINKSKIEPTYKPNLGPIITSSLGPKHTGREVRLQNGSLRITKLRLSDAGDYTVQLMTLGRFMQSTVHLRVSDKRTSVRSTSQPRLARTAGPSALSTGGKGVLAGAFVGAIVGTALLTTTAVLLCKRHRKLSKRRRHQPIPPPRKDLEIPSHRPSVGTDGYVDPREIHAPPHRYETVGPYPPKDQASPTPEEEHVYTELEYADGTIYNTLHV
ncbi:uncharacterized protein [Pleurodeles waltl]|uniref:uncharacterized protein isoform X2 n=1 Tax=Pleurodeles waltl TaxID=8319 RepID=UPI003709BE1E